MPMARFERIRDLKNFLGLVRAPAGEMEGQLTRTLELVVDAEQLRGVIMGYMIDLYGAQRAALLLWNAEASRLQEVWRTGYEAEEEILFVGEGRLVRWLQVNETSLWPARQTAVVDYLEAEERMRLNRLGAELCIPLHAMNRLVGLILLGGLAPGPHEEVPKFLVTQIGLALQNAALYAQQQLRLRRLSRTERLATAGELAASAAHEIRNPLTAISSAVQLLGEAFPPGNPRREVADNVMREIDRINQIVEGLLSFARPAEPKRETIPLRQVIEEAMELVQTMAHKSGVEMQTDFAAPRDALQGDKDQLIQVFINLFMNSIQAMPDGGTLQVRLSRPRRYRIEVEDTGTGMTTEEVERAFDPFYTTKERGTGLGLPICYGIVRSHGGEIDLESTPGEGTVVRVEL